MKIAPQRKSGFTLVEIMIVVAIIGMLAAMALPNLVRARGTAQTGACINNLKYIDGAKQQWALETRQSDSATPTQVEIGPYLGRAGTTTNVLCPAGGPGATFVSCYAIGIVTNSPACLILPAVHLLN